MVEKVFLWGTGKVASDVINEFDVFNRYDVLGFIDNNKSNIGKVFFGKEVFSPDVLQTVEANIIVSLTDYYDEIAKQIKEEYPELKCTVEDKRYFYKMALKRRYAGSTDVEIKKVLEYIDDHGLDVFNYSFVQKYTDYKAEAYFDNMSGLYYVMHNGKKMYISGSFDTKEKAEKYYKSLLIEQDENSPHRYLTDDFNVNSGDVIVDAGAAEGIFTLDVIDKVKRAYLIEADEKWIEALKLTFADYMEKIVIVDKYLSDDNIGNYASLDEVIPEPVDFIKMDIEGCEWEALQGASVLIEKSPRLKCAVCVYHRDYDSILIQHEFAKHNMMSENTSGYMWFPGGVSRGQGSISTKLCRGILRAWK